MTTMTTYLGYTIRTLGLLMLSPALLIAAWYDWRHPSTGSYYISWDDLKFFILHG